LVNVFLSLTHTFNSFQQFTALWKREGEGGRYGLKWREGERKRERHISIVSLLLLSLSLSLSLFVFFFSNEIGFLLDNKPVFCLSLSVFLSFCLSFCLFVRFLFSSFQFLCLSAFFTQKHGAMGSIQYNILLNVITDNFINRPYSVKSKRHLLYTLTNLKSWKKTESCLSFILRFMLFAFLNGTYLIFFVLTYSLEVKIVNFCFFLLYWIDPHSKKALVTDISSHFW